MKTTKNVDNQKLRRPKMKTEKMKMNKIRRGDSVWPELIGPFSLVSLQFDLLNQSVLCRLIDKFDSKLSITTSQFIVNIALKKHILGLVWTIKGWDYFDYTNFGFIPKTFCFHNLSCK